MSKPEGKEEQKTKKPKKGNSAKGRRSTKGRVKKTEKKTEKKQKSQKGKKGAKSSSSSSSSSKPVRSTAIKKLEKYLWENIVYQGRQLWEDPEVIFESFHGDWMPYEDVDDHWHFPSLVIRIAGNEFGLKLSDIEQGTIIDRLRAFWTKTDDEDAWDKNHAWHIKVMKDVGTGKKYGAGESLLKKVFTFAWKNVVENRLNDDFTAEELFDNDHTEWVPYDDDVPWNFRGLLKKMANHEFKAQLTNTEVGILITRLKQKWNDGKPERDEEKRKERQRYEKWYKAQQQQSDNSTGSRKKSPRSSIKRSPEEAKVVAQLKELLQGLSSISDGKVRNQLMSKTVRMLLHPDRCVQLKTDFDGYSKTQLESFQTLAPDLLPIVNSILKMLQENSDLCAEAFKFWDEAIKN
jgi:hypothetical protein